ncbi:MAG: tetratricopeptide repeat protein [Novosphingobium sp.]
MTWALVILLALAALLAMCWLLEKPRSGRTAIAAALLVGLAGYAAQSHPSLPGSPTAARETVKGDAAAVATRQSLSAAPPGSDKWIVIADAMARNGRYADAATVLRGSVKHDPNNAEAWLAMANALVSHADQRLSPAALLAFRRAEAAQPANPGPPFFLGLALAQSGRLEEGRTVWADLLARTPPDAPWRADLMLRLQELDAFIAEQAAQGRRTG